MTPLYCWTCSARLPYDGEDLPHVKEPATAHLCEDCAPVPLRFIRLERVEGLASECKPSPDFLTWGGASSWLRRQAETAPRAGHGYHKTDFLIVWEDGAQYRGRFDLQHPTAQDGEPLDLRAHVRGYLRFLAGLEKPAHMDADSYAETVAKLARAVDAAEMLEKYIDGKPFQPVEISPA